MHDCQVRSNFLNLHFRCLTSVVYFKLNGNFVDAPSDEIRARLFHAFYARMEQKFMIRIKGLAHSANCQLEVISIFSLLLFFFDYLNFFTAWKSALVTFRWRYFKIFTCWALYSNIPLLQLAPKFSRTYSRKLHCMEEYTFCR